MFENIKNHFQASLIFAKISYSDFHKKVIVGCFITTICVENKEGTNGLFTKQ